jgi:superfamily I DNA and/or RNA helicase
LEALMKPNGERKELFIKNLENIQGDERDVIFISVGYGRDANGKLTQNFGPIGRDGGDRRLNVLITRARKRCEVFSSITAEDIRLDGPGKPGVRALKEFLKLAKDGYAAVAMETERGFDSRQGARCGSAT